MRKIIVVGGGAAGMIAAISAAENGNQVVLIEKNEKLGKKIYITGKGRCNLTNCVTVQDFFSNVVSNPKFVFSCVNKFSPQKTMDYFTNLGLELKIERGNRVFPASDKASDVTKALEKRIKQLGVDLRLNCTAKKVNSKDGSVVSVDTCNETINCDSVIVCTGGISYPLTGSTGDGYDFAKELGHKIISLKPALVGLELCGSNFIDLQGLSLKNVSISIKKTNKLLYSDFGEMLFTHFGVSGPIILSASSIINKENVQDLDLYIDLKPALDVDTLTTRLIREFKENKAKELSTVMRSLLPKNLIEVVLRQANVSMGKNCSEITVGDRFAIIDALKNLRFKLKKLRPIEEAIVTSGGICVNEVNPKTMESKLVKGLYFAGEVLDVDAFTGGFNLQLAFSTGYVAGINS